MRSQALKVVHDMFAFDVASDAEEDMPVSEIKNTKDDRAHCGEHFEQWRHYVQCVEISRIMMITFITIPLMSP